MDKFFEDRLVKVVFIDGNARNGETRVYKGELHNDMEDDLKHLYIIEHATGRKVSIAKENVCKIESLGERSD